LSTGTLTFSTCKIVSLAYFFIVFWDKSKCFYMCAKSNKQYYAYNWVANIWSFQIASLWFTVRPWWYYYKRLFCYLCKRFHCFSVNSASRALKISIILFLDHWTYDYTIVFLFSIRNFSAMQFSRSFSFPLVHAMLDRMTDCSIPTRYHALWQNSTARKDKG